MKPDLLTADFPLPPVHSALVTLGVPTGGVRVFPAAWVGMVCSRPMVLSVAVRSCRLRAGREMVFAVNLPSRNLLASSLLSQRPAGPEGDVSTFPGLTFVTGLVKGTRLIRECPVRVECRGGTIRSRFGQDFIQGEVVAVHTEETSFTGESLPTHPGRLGPFARAWSRCPNRADGASPA